MAPLQLCLAVFRDFRRGGKKIHAQPMGDGKHRNGNWRFHPLETSCAEEIQDPSTLVTSCVGVCYVSSGLLLTSLEQSA